jgi:DNA polymerase III epsilon subunit-like protein
MIFDVETTGFLESKPYIVSIAYNVYKLENNVTTLMLEKYNVVKPHNDSYQFPKESVNVHKITTEYAKEHGIPIQQVISDLHDLFDCYCIDTIIAHNISFDVGVLSIQLNRYDKHSTLLTEKIKDIKSYCTMKETTELVNIKRTTKTGRTYTKFPKLIELYQYLFPNETFEEHNAKFDVAACARCYFKVVYDYDIDIVL